ncbi:MAG: FtsX-like permease family protein [Burkholderiaceae bacterium]
MLIFSLALRNVFRHRVRSTVALGAIAFSTVVLMLAGGFVEWIFWAMREAATETGLGHIQVMQAGYLENGAADPYAFLLPDDSKILSSLEKEPHVKAVARRLNFSGLISYGDATLSFVGSGVEPSKEDIVSKSLPILDGANLADGVPDGIILGAGLAGNLGVPVGGRVVLLVNTASGGVSAVEATVRGLFSTQVKAFDDVALKVPLPMARRLLKVTGTHVWVFALDDLELAGPVARQWTARYPDSKLEFRKWSDLADFYNKTVRLLSSQMGIVRLLIGLIIVLGISNMLVMNVLERTGEVGTLMAMGARRLRIIQLFIGEGVLLGLVGGLIGLVVAWLLAITISAIGIPMPPPPGRSVGYSAGIRLDWSLAGWAFGLAVGSALLASLYPAWKASRLVVVDALRQNR